MISTIIYRLSIAYPRRREEAAKAQQIAEMEEAAMAREGKYNSKAEEVESKTKKMRKLHKKVRQRGLLLGSPHATAGLGCMHKRLHAMGIDHTQGQPLTRLTSNLQPNSNLQRYLNRS